MNIPNIPDDALVPDKVRLNLTRKTLSPYGDPIVVPVHVPETYGELRRNPPLLKDVALFAKLTKQLEQMDQQIDFNKGLEELNEQS